MTYNPLEEQQRRLDRFARKTYKAATPNIFGQKYQWVFGFTKEGKKVIWGPYYDAQEAERDLTTLDDGEVFDLETRDMTRATREIKSELMQRGEDPDEVLKRVLHKRSEPEPRRKRRGRGEE